MNTCTNYQRPLRCLLILSLVMAGSQVVSAAVITDLFNTGVDNAGAALPSFSIDPHYAITSPAQNAIVPGSIPSAWVPNNLGSQWIQPQNNPGGIGPFTYRTTFTLPATANLSSVVITGLWGTDNPGTDMRVNGASTGLTNVVQFTALTPFTLDSSNSTFVAGTNVLEIDLSNVNGPTGLRIDRISGTFVPEPSGFLLFGTMGLFGLRFRRRL